MMQGKVLVVDDNTVSRRKLAMAVKGLGHMPVEADSGAAALAMLPQGGFDLILLDIIMPEIDGFEVLTRLKADRDLAEIPVLVISGLEDDTESVARAIKLGAEDFLPKNFDLTVFRARVTACIDRKRLREAELEYLRHVDTLTAAAEVMEGAAFHPRSLRLDNVAGRTDALGRLARVFAEMAQQVYDRERSLQRNIRTLKGGTLMLIMGIVSGLSVPMSIMIFDHIPLPLGAAFWVNLLSGTLCLAYAWVRGLLPKLDGTVLRFVLAYAILHGVSSVLVFSAGGRVGGITLSILLALEGFMVFLIATILRIEDTSLRRFAGLCLGLVGVVTLLTSQSSLGGVGNWVWLGVAVLIPLIFGFMDLLLAVRTPKNLDPVAGTGMALVGSALLSLPLVLMQHEFVVPGLDLGFGGVLLLLEAMRMALVSVMFIYLILVAGAVFGSQSAYVSTAAGIGWSVLLLSESLTIAAVGALVLIVIGLAIVGPEREAADLEIQFVRRGPRKQA